MTFAQESSAMLQEGPSERPDWKRRYFQKRYLCSWILVALLPFIFLRLLFMVDFAFPFRWPSSSSIGVQPEEPMSQGQAPGPGPAEEAKTSLPESPPVIRPDEDAWTTHEDWINHDLGLRDNQGKDEKRIPDGSDNSTDFMKPFSSKSENGDDFGLPEDNEEEELDLEATQMTDKEKKQTSENPTTAEETASQPRNATLEEGHFESGNAQSEDEKNVRDEEDERSRVDEHTGGVAPESHSEHEKAEQNNPGEPSDEQRHGGEQPNPAVVKPLAGPHEADEKVDKDKENPQAGTNPTHEEMPAGKCDLFEGEWEHDPEGPMYTNSTCFYIQESQNCMSNGRPDSEYMYWRWKPRNCDLPRFDAKAFLDSFRGQAIGFVGDSIARNQMQSLLCLLAQVEIPVKTYVSEDDQTVRWLFKEHQVTLAVVWSSFLLKHSMEGVMGFEKGQIVLSLDELDPSWTSVMNDFDIVVFVTGQWYYKSAVYTRQGKVVGCHYCPNLNLTDVGFYDAYRRGIREVLKKVSDEFKGISIMSTFPLSHFENGTWDSGGYCRREQPLNLLESKRFSGDHHLMRLIVVDAFTAVVDENRVMQKDARLEILDVTKVALQRADGHPGPFRNPHPFEGRDPAVFYPNDCLHWCLPGPIEAWNQLVVKIAEKYL